MAVDETTVIAAVLERLTADSTVDAAVAEAFVTAYLHRLPPAVDPDPEVLAAQIRSLLEFIRVRSDPVKVRAFNPTVEEHGYAASGTVIEINLADSPFLLDSVTNELEAHQLRVVSVLHPVLGIERGPGGELEGVRHARHTTSRESVQHYQLDRTLFEADLPALERSLRSVLDNVRAAVEAFHPIMARIDRMVDLVRTSVDFIPESDVAEAAHFLQWLRQDNFVFLGYREYRLIDTDQGKAVEVVPGTGLGILADESKSRVSEPVLLSSLPKDLAARYTHGALLVITKTNRLSPVHRRAKMDYIGVRILGPDGETEGEARLLGLFTSKAYMEPASDTPILRRKLHAIVSAEDLIEGSHDHKALVGLFEGFSKHDLFASSTEQLREALAGMLAIQERDQVRLFVRRDLLERSVSILVALPRERFNTTLRRRLQDLFMERFHGSSCEYHLALGEADPAQIHFTVWVESADVPEVDFHTLESEVMALARSWPEQVVEELSKDLGESAARRLAAVWGQRFPDYYLASTPIGVAAGDIRHLDALLESERVFAVGLQNEVDGGEGDRLTRVALYRRDGKQPLTALMPALEALGLEVIEEIPTRLQGSGALFIHDFGVKGPDGRLLDVSECAERVRATLEAVWANEVESDDLNRLVIQAGLRHDQVEILRAYRTYWRRVAPVFTVGYVNDTLVSHPDLAAHLVEYFELRFDPRHEGADADAVRDRLLQALDDVPSLEQDRILRTFVHLIEATVRTNFYLPDRAALVFKLKSSMVPDIPAPHPMAEIFVLAQDVEGIHLRGGMVARGGIRWSTRREDYRTEVLGLMKAQVTKNAVIVPTGAKGGFVLRRAPDDPAELRAEVERCYRVFIEALLDVTDNLVDGGVVHPELVRAHDGDDPYLVVAADKGTATFSDVANEIAIRRGFWLGDAFASGGSTGYDHKALGITARGAWESLVRHFREIEIDPYTDAFTAVGIGDMSGDVFGNGMLGSDRIKLVAAFDHRDIFIDPDPDPSASYAERRRLFELPRSSWADYDRDKLSQGGAVFSRSAKKIELSPEARSVLGTEAVTVTPVELIRIVLAAPVHLLWNGGIGTYVKASTESHADVGDRTNDAVRIDGSDLRARVVVEGGNLGLTQRARIEFASKGGRINTDFIDNSGGVDCSDREVNLKILLDLAHRRGELTVEERNRLISEVADDVVERILYDNFQQAQMLSQEQAAAGRRFEAYEELMTLLEQETILDRELEGLPSSEEMAERARTGRPLTRPELSVLLADAKRSLEDAIIRSELPDSPYLLGDLGAYFPPKVGDQLGHLVAEHPLRRELVATLVANDVVNSEGVVFVTRLATQTGADPAEIVAAYRIARDVTGAVARWQEIEELFGKLDIDLWTSLMQHTDRMVASVTRWYLAHRRSVDLGEVVAAHGPRLAEIEEAALDSGPVEWRRGRLDRIEHLVELGVPRTIAARNAVLPILNYAPDIVEVSADRSVAEVLPVFLHLGPALGFDRLTEMTRSISGGDRWQRWGLWTVEEDLIAMRRVAAERVLGLAEGRHGVEAVDHFLTSRAHAVARLVRFLRSLEASPPGEIAPLVVAIRQIRATVA